MQYENKAAWAYKNSIRRATNRLSLFSEQSYVKSVEKRESMQLKWTLLFL